MWVTDGKNTATDVCVCVNVFTVVYVCASMPIYSTLVICEHQRQPGCVGEEVGKTSVFLSLHREQRERWGGAAPRERICCY